MHSSTLQSLPDVQSYDDTRNLAIDQVGVTSVPYPIQFVSRQDSGETPQSTTGMFDLFVSLPPTEKGTHMSRFVQLLRDWPQPLDYVGAIELCDQLRDRMDADRADIEIRFPYFVQRAAPVTKELGLLRLDVKLNVSIDRGAAADRRRDLRVTVSGPATSLCPCSKEISDYGAHNQRCQLTASVRFRVETDGVSIDDLFETMEKAASCRVYATLKRSDEKKITENAYENPKFVEDTVRDLALGLKADSRISWFRCESENFESIHQHNAFARIEMQT
ncbi:GTP cyclohydrolase FolE2 [Allorhodopirellula solitaria]|uniref:GTP cyclohydrolase FolE2 n=1 Tax=Allorhodopirellula solitaria TaxID=2527987 RepID=A0A5C5YCA0_9BACT|nr:GTP cyclohydrolase FolE2 [Allorhodopirellula solitaria]TWT73336.1 GTP cyclohydrolase FolE2 [Allorhodopirellula solitaria]